MWRSAIRSPCCCATTFPFSLGSGLALAAVLCFGRRLLPGVMLGHGAFLFVIALENGQPWVLGALCLGSSMVVQVLAGDWLLRRFIKNPLDLNGIREILRFVLLTGLVIGAVGATAGLLAYRVAYGFATRVEIPHVWLDLWVSKSGGMLVGTPLTLALLAHPRESWRPAAC